MSTLPFPTPPSNPPAQAKRLEELEKLYRDEQVARKRAFNAMEDMKGKIRVYCRVRPILPFETDKGQVGGRYWIDGSP